MPKTFKIVPMWRNFAKSGHNGTSERDAAAAELALYLDAFCSLKKVGFWTLLSLSVFLGSLEVQLEGGERVRLHWNCIFFDADDDDR